MSLSALAVSLPNGFSITKRVSGGTVSPVRPRQACSITGGGSAKYRITGPDEHARKRRSRSLGSVTSARMYRVVRTTSATSGAASTWLAKACWTRSRH